MDDTETLATYGSDGTCQNDSCGRTTVKKGPYGPPRRYCSTACRVAAYRQRQADDPTGTPVATGTTNATNVTEAEDLQAVVDAIDRYIKNPALLRAVVRPGSAPNETALKILTDLTDVIDSN